MFETAELGRRVPRSVFAGLERKGHNMKAAPEFFAKVGHAHGIVLRDGTLTARRADLLWDGGAYASNAVGIAIRGPKAVFGPYRIPAVEYESRMVYTNRQPTGSYRGYGTTQAAWACESQMDMIAHRLGIDPLEIRRRNGYVDGDTWINGQVMHGVNAGEPLERVAREIGWGEATNPAPAPHLRRGKGIATMIKETATPTSSNVLLKVEQDGRLVVLCAAPEIGAGQATVLCQMAADAVGVPADHVQLVASDTAHTANSGSASASRLTFMAGNSIRGAAEAALEKWHAEERPAIASYTYRPPRTSMFDPETGECEPNFAYGYVAEAVTVEVDTETGHVRLLKVVCADDVGKAINPQLVRGQIEGGVVQAAGYAVLEDFIQKDGYVVTPHLSSYLIPTVLDVPEKVESLILEFPDPRGPFGSRGMAEMPFLPLAPAVVAAVHDAIGVWFDRFPLTPERVQRGIKETAGE